MSRCGAWPRRSSNFKKSFGPRSIGAIVGAQATNEEAFALKRLMLDTIGSDRIAMVSYTPPGMSGDDDFLIRANKNPNTRGLEAMGIPPAHFGEFGKGGRGGRTQDADR